MDAIAVLREDIECEPQHQASAYMRLGRVYAPDVVYISHNTLHFYKADMTNKQ